MGIWRYEASREERQVERGRHIPVLLERCLELLTPALERPGAVHVDATLGLGGHAQAVLDAFPNVKLVGLDRDPQALAIAGERLAPYQDSLPPRPPSTRYANGPMN